ncbi:hypothetical protein BH24ACT26_BH24ACT26_03280 [soil metagenome]
MLASMTLVNSGVELEAHLIDASCQTNREVTEFERLDAVFESLGKSKVEELCRTGVEPLTSETQRCANLGLGLLERCREGFSEPILAVLHQSNHVHVGRRPDHQPEQEQS